MERLTIPDVRVDEHTTRRTMIDGEAVREHAMDFYWRLKAYEDTGLMPGEVHSMSGEWRAMMSVLNSIGGGYDRLLDLDEADKDGRVVVLPCKVDDTVYRIVRDADPHITRDEVRNMYFADDMTLCVELISGRIILPEKFGKTVFLTREEAEKALEAMKDE